MEPKPEYPCLGCDLKDWTLVNNHWACLNCSPDLSGWCEVCGADDGQQCDPECENYPNIKFDKRGSK